MRHQEPSHCGQHLGEENEGRKASTLKLALSTGKTDFPKGFIVDIGQRLNIFYHDTVLI